MARFCNVYAATCFVEFIFCTKYAIPLFCLVWHVYRNLMCLLLRSGFYHFIEASLVHPSNDLLLLLDLAWHSREKPFQPFYRDSIFLPPILLFYKHARRVGPSGKSTEDHKVIHLPVVAPQE